MTNKWIPLDQVMINLGGDPKLLHNILQLSLRILPKQLDTLQLALNDKNPKAIQLAAHTLRSSLVIFLCQPMIKTAKEIETLGAEGKIEQANALFSTLEAQISALLKEIEMLSQVA